MKHLLMDPAFPDLVAAAAAEDRDRDPAPAIDPATPVDRTDEFLAFLGKAEIALTRLW